MSRIGIISLYAAGHLNPSLVLARALKAADHEPVIFNLPDTRQAVESSGIEFVPFGEHEYPAGTLLESMQKSATLSGADAFVYYIERMITFFQASFNELPDAIRCSDIDLLVIDQAHYGASTISELLGIPYISMANALPLNREDAIPPPIMAWPFEDTLEAIERNRKGWLAVDQALAPLLNLINVQREQWSLKRLSTIEDSFSTLAQICQLPALLDFPRANAPRSLQYIGHLLDSQSSEDSSFPWDWLDGRPLIYASCGTLQNRLPHLFRAFIDACGSLDVQAVIALGRDGLDPASFGDIPSNIKLLPYVPQNALLHRASACITHAGLNTTLDCLENGVPMVTIPIASEQPGIAMRSVRLGVGVLLPLTELTADRLRGELEKVLSDKTYRAAAMNVARSIAQLRPAEEAVRVIEATLLRSSCEVSPLQSQ